MTNETCPACDGWGGCWIGSQRVMCDVCGPWTQRPPSETPPSTAEPADGYEGRYEEYEREVERFENADGTPRFIDTEF